MDYNALIQNRKSVRAFRSRKVAASVLSQIRDYYNNDCPRLVPDIKTELLILDDSFKDKLEGSAGYDKAMIGAPDYMVLLSDPSDKAELNGGFIMEELILRLTEMEISTCWITFSSSDEVSAALGIDTSKKIVAVAAFGYGERTTKRLRLNIKNMSNVDISAKRGYFTPKKSIYDITYIDKWGNSEGLDETIGFYDDILWQALYASSMSPSYLNRQPYGIVISEGKAVLVSIPDTYTDKVSADLGLGIVMSHFAGSASASMGRHDWQFDVDASSLELPEGYTAVASYTL